MNAEPPFELKGNANEFEEIDPYNPQNRVRGYINRSGNSKYGALWITHVNDRECPQMIWGTPKMHYPQNFFKDTFFKPPVNSQVEVYEKYDGTNILAYLYYDADGKGYMSFKTRLRPFLGVSKFGDFKRLWDEILDTNRIRGDIERIMYYEKLNLSFELFGSRNKILIEYSTPLDYKLLFGVDGSGKIIPPSEIETVSFPKAMMFESFPGDDVFEKEYERVRTDLNKKLIVVKVDVDGEEKIESMSGCEGAVMYVISKGSAVQLKAKPDEVQDIHWAESKGIPYHSIYTTVINAFEETDNPTVDIIKNLLAEEFTPDQIERRYIAIIKILESVRFEKKLKIELREEYLKHDFDIVADKKTCMRYFGTLYDKRIAGKIYRYLMDEFGGENANKRIDRRYKA